MKLHIAPAYEHLRPQLERLPELFDSEAGEVLHAGRNTIRAIETDGQRLAVKRFKRPNALNALIYAYVRKSKAQRAYEHAERLRTMGIDTPEPIAWSEIRRRGVIADTYFVARFTSWRPLLDAIERYPEDDSRAVLEAFAGFTARLHEQGVEHKDFNSTNTIYACDPETRSYRFQLIDINRMHFHRSALTPDQGIANFRRLTGRTDAFRYLLDRYAAVRGLESFATRLKGMRNRLHFKYLRTLKYKLKGR
ncbi:MAG: LPS kinase Kdo/WaaP [Alistipes sp.]|nr:LPS kinase Kdo/WaaP [Alistipes sp.]